MGEKGQANAATGMGGVGSQMPPAGSTPQGSSPDVAGLMSSLAAADPAAAAAATAQSGGSDIAGLMAEAAAADPAAAAAATAQASGEKGQAQDSLGDLTPEQQLKLQQAQDAGSKAGQA